MFRRLSYCVCLSLYLLPCKSQENWAYTGNVNFGCNLTLNYRQAQRYPGLRFFCAFYANGVYKNHLLVNYGPSISIYTKSLGANLNPLVGDWQIDFINTLSFGYAWNGELSYTKYFQTINTASYYNIGSKMSYAAILSANFILNNHRRNQVVGSITVSTPSVTVNYYNDGAFPFDLVPVGDNFDRWWTGGFSLYVHSKKNYNSVEFSFDQFTGYSPLLYELSNLVGINLPSYQNADSSVNIQKGRMPPSFNTSAYNLKVHLSQNFALDAGIIGSLRTNSGKVFGLQDIIHTSLGYPLHPNNDINRYYIGGTYNHFTDVKL